MPVRREVVDRELAHASGNHFLQPNAQHNAGPGFSLDYDIVKAYRGDVKEESKQR
jgi:hypothetical protein